MKGRLYIDGNDAWERWGVYPLKGGYNGLAAYPPLKPYPSNDWHEEDGLEADLSAPRLDALECDLSLGFSRGLALALEMQGLVLEPGVHTVYAPALGIDRVFEFVLRGNSQLSIAGDGQIGSFTLKVTVPRPFGHEIAGLQPMGGVPYCGDCLIDSVPLTDYGCRMLKGSLPGILGVAQTKDNLSLDDPSAWGTAIDSDGGHAIKARDVRLRLLMRAPSLAHMWHNHKALLALLVKPGTRLLALNGRWAFECCYKSMAVNEFYPSGKLWLDFTLTLTLLGCLRTDSSQCVLTSEQGTPLALHSSDDALLLIKPLPK